jgi:anti-sigma regulatory factor (Ser/Thr protein kinase)
MDSADSPAGLRHNAFVYESDDHYAGQAAPLLEEGLAASEAAIVAGAADRLAVLREALGPSSERVTFIDTSSSFTRPARTVAMYTQAVLRELRTAPRVRVVGEVQYGPTPADRQDWIAYEAISSCAYAHLPAWVVCTYDATSAPDDVLDAVWRSHPEVLSDTWRESADFEDPAEILRATTPEPRPLPGLRSLSPGDDLVEFRERLAAELRAAGVSPGRTLEMLVGATEVAGNAWKHGGGPHELRVGTADGRFVCEVSDRGLGFDDPLAGYIVPGEDRGIGAGLWIARQMAWRVEVMPASPGMTVRLWA